MFLTLLLLGGRQLHRTEVGFRDVYYLSLAVSALPRGFAGSDQGSDASFDTLTEVKGDRLRSQIQAVHRLYDQREHSFALLVAEARRGVTAMPFDSEHFERLLQQARQQADQAAAQGDAQLQHAAFLTLLEAVRQLGAASGDWRRMVARATEDFQHDEGI